MGANVVKTVFQPNYSNNIKLLNGAKIEFADKFPSFSDKQIYRFLTANLLKFFINGILKMALH